MESTLLLAVQIGCLLLQAWAVVDCAVRRSPAFPAAGKLTKPAWLAITVVAGVVTFYFGLLGVLGVVGIVASLVYLADVRPAVRALTDRSNRR